MKSANRSRIAIPTSNSTYIAYIQPDKDNGDRTPIGKLADRPTHVDPSPVYPNSHCPKRDPRTPAGMRLDSFHKVW
jgi:hypothetical protein